MPPAEQVIHILGQPDLDLVWNTGTKTSPGSSVVLQEERRLIFQHQIRHIVGQIKELSVGCGALQPDSAI